ncbi:acyltransferase [Pseudomonas fluorescens]|uniref:acyltransferase family protein n=1 Tax=Pseudomonas fluorescens TaxID=294 RepID=UPI00352647A2
MQNYNTGAVPSLTGLRFIAAMMVFFSHFPLPPLHDRLTVIQESGYAGVTFFFLLSGFILSLNYLDSLSKFSFLSTYNYFVSRFARIYPVYIFCVFFVYFSRGANGTITTYVLATQAWNPEYWIAFGLVSQSWSISVEIFLYAMFPLILPLLHWLKVSSSRFRLILIFIALVICQFSLAYYFSQSGQGLLHRTNPDSAHHWLYRFPVTRLLDFSMGITAAIYYRRFLTIDEKTKSVSSFLTYASIVVIILLMSSGRLLYTPYSFDAMYALPFTILIFSLAVARHTFASSVLSMPKIVMLGEASYALYLLQVIVSSSYVQSPGASSFIWVVNQAFFLALLIAASIGMHRMVEKPCQRVIRSVFSIKERARGIYKAQQAPTSTDPVVGG